MVSQWQAAGSKFEVNIFNFTTLAGEAATDVFDQSFYLHRFNSAGEAAWPARKRKGNGHALLEETGSLRQSIKWSMLQEGVGNYTAKVYTDPREFIGELRNREGKCYAAIHNEGGGVAKPGSPASYIPQRQFIGHSTVLNDKLALYSRHILDGLPK